MQGKQCRERTAFWSRGLPTSGGICEVFKWRPVWCWVCWYLHNGTPTPPFKAIGSNRDRKAPDAGLAHGHDTGQLQGECRRGAGTGPQLFWRGAKKAASHAAAKRLGSLSRRAWAHVESAGLSNQPTGALAVGRGPARKGPSRECAETRFWPHPKGLPNYKSGTVAKTVAPGGRVAASPTRARSGRLGRMRPDTARETGVFSTSL